MDIDIPFLADCGLVTLTPHRETGNVAPAQFDDCYIFLGPTLSLIEARAVLPKARFLPPVACGDLISLSRLNPKIVIVFDGYFESRPAVWHKEIHYLLSRGTLVYGASSMGALRARELDTVGMIGLGGVYEAYRRDLIEGDDEVAVVHSDSAFGYLNQTIALVNLRYHLGRLISDGRLTEARGIEIVAAAKGPYFERTANHLQSIAPEIEMPVADLKRRDALAALRDLANPMPRPSDSQPFVATRLFMALQRDLSCQPFPVLEEWLPERERAAFLADSLLSEPERKKVRLLARLLWIFDQTSLSTERAMSLGSPSADLYKHIFFDSLDDFENRALNQIISRLVVGLDAYCDQIHFQPDEADISRRTDSVAKRLNLSPSSSCLSAVPQCVRAHLRMLELCVYQKLSIIPHDLKLTDRFFFDEALSIATHVREESYDPPSNFDRPELETQPS